MRRGNISNKPASIIAIDWKILARIKQKRLQNLRSIEVEFLDGAYGWLERNYEHRFCAVIVGTPKERRVIKKSMDMVVPLSVQFNEGCDVSVWMKRNPQVIKFYTNDVQLMCSISTAHSGWNQKVHYGL
jgi:hypothetical protein